MTSIPALGPRGEGWVLLQLTLILVIAILGALALPAAIAGWPARWPFVIQGALLLGVGGWVVIQGARRLGNSLTAMPRPREDASLVQDGIYARVRHPMYAGIAGLGLGWALVTLSLPALVAALVLALVLDLKARREEGWLAERYTGYPEYRSRTHRFIRGVY
ncbi:MAG: isoprenylcysteine carboxylmethyltransferase family protein [Chloroflexota bacterium]